jgi:hypothetical protein
MSDQFKYETACKVLHICLEIQIQRKAPLCLSTGKEAPLWINQFIENMIPVVLSIIYQQNFIFIHV